MAKRITPQQRLSQITNSIRKSHRQELLEEKRNFRQDLQQKGFEGYVAYLIDNLLRGFEPAKTTTLIGYLIGQVDKREKLPFFQPLLDVLINRAEMTTEDEVMKTTLLSLGSASENTLICELLDRKGIINCIYNLASSRNKLMSMDSKNVIFRIYVEVEEKRRSLNEPPIEFLLARLLELLCSGNLNITAAVLQVKHLFRHQYDKIPVALILSLASTRQDCTCSIVCDPAIQQKLVQLMRSENEPIWTKYKILLTLQAMTVWCSSQVLKQTREYIPYMFEAIGIAKDWHFTDIALSVLRGFFQREIQIYDMLLETSIILQLQDQRVPHKNLAFVVLSFLRTAVRPRRSLMTSGLHMKIQAKLGRCKQLMKEVHAILDGVDEEMGEGR